MRGVSTLDAYRCPTQRLISCYAAKFYSQFIRHLLSKNVETLHATSLRGLLSDYFREQEQAKTYSPIFEYPNFEYLEAEGDRGIG